MAANRTIYLQNLVLMWRLYDCACYKLSYTITPSTQCNACCKCENESFLPGALVGKNSDPQTGWIGGGSLRQTGCSFQVDKFQQIRG